VRIRYEWLLDYVASVEAADYRDCIEIGRACRKGSLCCCYGWGVFDNVVLLTIFRPVIYLVLPGLFIVYAFFEGEVPQKKMVDTAVFCSKVCKYNGELLAVFS